MSSPRSAVLSADSDCSVVFAPHFVTFAGRYLTGGPLRSQRPDQVPSGLGCLSRGARTAMTVRNGGALPGSWVTLADMPCSSTPAEGRYQALRYRPCGLPLLVQRRLRELAFEAQSHGLHAPCVRFAAGVAPGPRNTRFRWIASPYRSGTFTRRVTIRGFRSSGFPLHVLPPLPGLAWRKQDPTNSDIFACFFLSL